MMQFSGMKSCCEDNEETIIPYRKGRSKCFKSKKQSQGVNNWTQEEKEGVEESSA